MEHKPWRVAREDVVVCCARNLIVTDFGLLRSKCNLITISITGPTEVIGPTSTDSNNFHQGTQCITGWPLSLRAALNLLNTSNDKRYTKFDDVGNTESKIKSSVFENWENCLVHKTFGCYPGNKNLLWSQPNFGSFNKFIVGSTKLVWFVQQTVCCPNQNLTKSFCWLNSNQPV